MRLPIKYLIERTLGTIYKIRVGWRIRLFEREALRQSRRTDIISTSGDLTGTLAIRENEAEGLGVVGRMTVHSFLASPSKGTGKSPER